MKLKNKKPLSHDLFSKLVLASFDQPDCSSDGGFATPSLLDYLELEGVEYLVEMPGNSRLGKRARRLWKSGIDKTPWIPCDGADRDLRMGIFIYVQPVYSCS